MPIKPLLIVMSAPSGAGKTTLCDRLLDEYPGITYSVSCTTRDPRGAEVDGEDYFFMTEDGFMQRVREGMFLEHAIVHGNRYGTLKATVMDSLKEGLSVLMDIDVVGAQQIRDVIEELPDDDVMVSGFVDIFILPPSLEELEERLLNRDEDDPAVVATRLHNAQSEMGASDLYKYRIVNDDLERAYGELRSVIEREWQDL